MNKITTFTFIGIFILISVKSYADNDASISIHHGKYSDYYHIKYKLTKNNFIMGKEPIYDNGQFEIFVNKQDFPIPANNCKDKLILRMPATLSDSNNHEKSIKRKISLYKAIKNVYEGDKESIDVIIELNPYVQVKSRRPLELELGNCNIFFRTKNNSYIDTL